MTAARENDYIQREYHDGPDGGPPSGAKMESFLDYHMRGEPDWAKLERRELETPFKPSVAGDLDVSYFDDEFTSQPIAESVMPETALGGKGQQYEGFTYVDKGHLG